MFIFIKISTKIFRKVLSHVEYLYYRFFYSKPKLNNDVSRKRYFISENLGEEFAQLFSEKKKDKIVEADLICRHIFNLLGSGPKKLSPEGNGYQPIDWHSDFKSNYRWNPKTFYINIKFGNIKGVDVKVPWELSRFQHLNILGQAYLLTKDKKYSEEFANQIQDWIKHNPVAFGVNWRCTMDIAIRAVNWLVAMEYFAGGEDELFGKEFLNEFYVSIYEHAKFIYSHLEYSKDFTSNHYLADIAGLFFITVYCPFFKESVKWQKFALKELFQEIGKQVYEDGCDFEASTSYHCLVLEMFFYAELLGKRAGIAFPEHYSNRLKKMFEFSLYSIKPNGEIPQIGDNDSGRFLIFSKRPILEHKYLLTLAAIYYQDAKYKTAYFDFDKEAFWIFGKSGKEIFDKLIVRQEPIVSKDFPKAGWYVIRHNNDYCFISCGPNGQNGRGGHAHNDKLSFELSLNGQDIIVDPGTYVYTPYPKERNKFRSTEYHNVVKFNKHEQNEISEKHIFSLSERVKIISANLRAVDDNINFEGEIEYFNFRHKRIIGVNKKSGNWQIIDNIFCLEPVSVKVLFHLSPDVFFEEGYIFLRETRKKIALIEVENYKLNKKEYDYSP
ncbi:MAG: alginate lyase family protein, partial [Candidatus Omnitrophota bacterium]